MIFPAKRYKLQAVIGPTHVMFDIHGAHSAARRPSVSGPVPGTVRWALDRRRGGKDRMVLWVKSGSFGL